MMNPQTPPRKQLFKPSSKTKTPTPVKRQRPSTPTPSSAQSHDILTPTETVSRSTDAFGALDVTQGPVSDAIEESVDSEQADTPIKSIAGKPREVLSPSTDDLPEPLNPTDALNSPTDIAKYFAEQGNSEMSTFVSALTGQTPHIHSSSVDSNAESNQEALGDAPDTKSTATKESFVDAPETIKELPRDDNLIIPPNMRSQDAEGGGNEGTLGGATEKIAEVKDTNQNQDLNNNILDITSPANVSKEAEGTTNNIKKQASGVKPLNAVGGLDTSDIAKEAQVGISGKPNSSNSSKEPSAGLPNGKAHATDAGRNAAGSARQQPKTGVLDDGTRVADNMGQPAHIDRRIEIPLPRPEKVISSPPQPSKLDTNNIATGLNDPNDLPGTEGLANIDELAGYPDDPPEEILDPSVHSPSSNISPIPKIPKIKPIGMAPPPDLLHLARGLGGHEVDDVGNIVDESGKVLGHATGDLPAMVGKKVADNGEVYGERGEIIGYVSENFTGPPPPADIPGDVLGGLKVDHEGNILDSSGNIIGRFNEKAGQNGGLPPFKKPSKTGESQSEGDKPSEEKKPKVNAHTGGSPSDIFLDVKSTTDGIQLTIRIPTTFGRQPQE
ncbi:uncharacterized protein F4822DRAFT_275268 [Hypoxylon trugodes]|uniref:uncharacterized protein n=1 Tax=Hypoxylon trugodes TaxID=326681 RepID=UPI0021A1E011|nr:uncharacterized protein F4822DRAFT_275268 [Hypoxylon trugodes]KAI1387147.1 hypothetical protein F4822DRAFT_275268 [Hypoxylon trugodes]